MQVGEVADLVDEHRAAVAADVLVRPEHEVVEQQLPAPFEQIGQRDLACRAVEGVTLLDSHARQHAALSRERVAGPSGLLLLAEQRVVCCLPLRLGDDRWKVHGAPLGHSYSVHHSYDRPPSGNSSALHGDRHGRAAFRRTRKAPSPAPFSVAGAGFEPATSGL
jgi:hypothetical protein